MTYAQILEDNAGGIHYVTAGGSCSHPGFYAGHPQAGKMLADLLSIADWIDDARADRPDGADSVRFDQAGLKVVAVLQDGAVLLYPQRMGNSASAYAGI